MPLLDGEVWCRKKGASLRLINNLALEGLNATWCSPGNFVQSSIFSFWTRWHRRLHRMQRFIFRMWKLLINPSSWRVHIMSHTHVYTGWPTKNGTVDTVDFSGLCSDQQLSFFNLLGRASFPHYNNTKIIKFRWELFISWVQCNFLWIVIFGICPISWVPRHD